MFDIKKWKEISLGSIFLSYTGGDLILNQVQEGDIPVISHSMSNNGISVYSSEIEGKKLFDCKKTISLADRGTFYAAVQSEDFYIGTRVKALEFKDGKHSKEVLLFFATLINNEKFRFNYGRNCTGGIDNLKIKVPLDENGNPNYAYIESYMSKLSDNISDIPDYFLDEGYDKACWYMDNIDQNKFETEYAAPFRKRVVKLQDRKWDKFIIREIVSDVHNGKPYNASDLINAADGNDYISYVTRTDNNNGVSMYVQVDDYDGLENGGAITVGDTTSTIFYQKDKFITGPHIIVIRADWFNIYTANFFITLMNLEKYRYPVFGRAFTKDLIKETVIMLPVTDKGKPDFLFMEEYIKSRPFSCNIQ